MPLGVEVGVDPIRVERGPLVSAEIPTGDDAGLRELRACGVETLKDLFETLLDRRSADAGPIVGLADGLIGALLRRPGLFAIPALGLPRPCDSLPDHCFSTGAIALGIAAQLGWPRADVRHAALSGFLADAGMALVAHPVRQAARPLTEIEVNAVRRHPEFTVGLLRNIRGLPEPVVLAAYQHQERADGSGYPLGLGSERLHDLAKVVGVAETFAGMTAPRAHRPALTPHAAMSELAHRAGARAFDRHVVRALVDLLGLYPARSFVRLSTGHVALVGAAAAPGTADRPVIHVVQPLGAGPRFGRPIDLARLEPKTLRIVEAIRTPEGIEV
jgi:hypothetical protein